MLWRRKSDATEENSLAKPADRVPESDTGELKIMPQAGPIAFGVRPESACRASAGTRGDADTPLSARPPSRGNGRQCGVHAPDHHSARRWRWMVGDRVGSRRRAHCRTTRPSTSRMPACST